MTQVATVSHRVELPRRPSYRYEKVLAWLLLLSVLFWSFSATGVWTRDLFNEGGWTIAMRFVRASVQPELSADFLLLTLHAAGITLAYAICGTALCLFFGTIGGLLSSEVWWRSAVRSSWLHRVVPYQAPWLTIRGLLAIPRAIHEAIWGLFLINVFGLSPLVALLAIGIPFGAITVKVFAEIIDETPRKSFDTLHNSGVRPFPAFCYTLLPQTYPTLLAYAFYRFECAIRAAAVLGIIGAGGLGYQLLLSMQSLRYEQMWTLLFALCLLNGVGDIISSEIRRRLGSAQQSRVHLDVAPTAQLIQPRRDPLVRTLLFVAFLSIPLSLWYIDIDWGRILSVKSYQLLIDIAHDSYPPMLDAAQLGHLVALAGQTLAMSILAMVIAAAGGLLFAFPAANNLILPGGILDTGGSRRTRFWLGGIVLVGTRGVLLFLRAVPPPIWALLALFLFFPGILPGAIALGIYNAGVLGRLMAEVVETLDPRPARALAAQGAGAGQIFLYSILPQTGPTFIGYILYRWEVCIRATVIVGLVGAGGIGRLLMEQLSSFDHRSVVTTLVMLILLTIVVDLLSVIARRTFP